VQQPEISSERMQTEEFQIDYNVFERLSGLIDLDFAWQRRSGP